MAFTGLQFWRKAAAELSDSNHDRRREQSHIDGKVNKSATKLEQPNVSMMRPTLVSTSGRDVACRSSGNASTSSRPNCGGSMSSSVMENSVGTKDSSTGLVREVAPLIRNHNVVRVRDKQTVRVESFWRKRTPSEDGVIPCDGIPAIGPSGHYLYTDSVKLDAPIGPTPHGRPVLMCLFRRWGCCICRMTAASLSSIKPFLDSKGIDLIGIGYEEIGLQKFIAAGHFAGELYLDMSRDLYKSIDCKTTNWQCMWGVLSPDVLRLYQLAQERHYVNNFKGDFSQFGGAVLIDAYGITRFLQVQTKQNFQIDVMKILDVIGVVPPEGFDPLPLASNTVW